MSEINWAVSILSICILSFGIVGGALLLSLMEWKWGVFSGLWIAGKQGA